ncbi:eukaryotic translation initiation factor 4 gamma 2 [Ostrinia nubilalis]|uniref:eukaryotic translation initiation factor 4 gamma 2 n=1 Tax=Ostrinia nubilalis TaxID=29057 RepID=UPI0030824701
MYAQLCKRLSEEAPNFEPPGQPCTFKLLLLNKCRTEFENRAQAFAAFEDKALSPEEEEKRHLAKCKMLGNIKFIGELGKLEILAESILHRCIQNLLARRAAADHHEDLECLAQLVRTCGRVLDSERGRGLMEQYFARIETLSASRELAPRIRFMLRDTVELRRGGWVPRAAVSAEGPVPIHQLRGDDEPPRRERERDRERERERDSLFRGGLRARPLDDVLAGLSLQPAAALVPPADKLFGNGFARDAFRQRSAPNYYPRQQPYKQAAPKEAGGRAGKARVYAVGAAALSDVQMRPAANSLMFTANRLSRPPALPPVQPNMLTPAFASAPPIIKEPTITIKPAPDKKDKPKKDKGVNKEEACRLALEVTEALAAECGDPRAPPDDDAGCAPLRRLQELQLPDKVRALGACRRALEVTEALAAECGDPRAPPDDDAGCAPLRRLQELQLPDKVRALGACRRALEVTEALAAECGDPRAPPDDDAGCAPLRRLQELQLPDKVRALGACRRALEVTEALAAECGDPRAPPDDDAGCAPLRRLQELQLPDKVRALGACRRALEVTEALAAECGDPRAPPDDDAGCAPLRRLQELQLPDKVRALGACRRALEVTEALAAECGDPRAPPDDDAGCAPLRRLQELQLPDKVLRRVITSVLEHALAAPGGAAGGEAGEGAAAAEGARAWAACEVVRAVKRAPVTEALRALACGAAAVEEAAGARRRLVALLAAAVRARVLALGELGAWCEGGAHHPLLLDALQELRALLGEERLRRLLDDTKIDLGSYAVAAEGAAAMEALEARGLGALVPQLRLQAQLQRQLAAEPAPQALYRWIKSNVEPGVRGNAAFVSTLVALLAGHVTGAAGSAAAGADKAALEREKALVEEYAPLLTALLTRPELQLAAVYAVQVHAHRHRYPKGMLLRWFMYLYNLEVCEEDAFLRWREDVTDAYPGKGEALFQVNTWLTWLQQQESEDEEAED